MKTLDILIVDDEKNIIDLLTRVVKSEGYHVFTASNGFEAIEIIQKNPIDIVLTDIKMPEMSGITLLNEIKKIDESIEVIIMTAFATVETAIDALKQGARDYIRKPFDLEEVVEAIQKTAIVISKEEDHMMDTEDSNEILVAESPCMKELMKMIHKVAHSAVTISIQGETGVGKELVARAIHNYSDRKDQPFIKVNCSAFPETLLESELFGYEKGAFTGAFTRKLGRFELANGGTIFLDEIGDISPLIQLKLLRVIQERELERLGGTETIPLDIRIITATNKDLETLVKQHEFREDLFYRLNVIPLYVPPLRERREDMPKLIQGFINIALNHHQMNHKTLAEDALYALTHYNWPGNVRELENIIERIIVISEGHQINLKDLPDTILSNQKELTPQYNAKIETAEIQVITNALLQTEGNITKAAELLGISRRSLHRKINKYDLHIS
ncbi:MAG: sigma-54-dependent Fis family transcriptional regulator [Clostridia bacterium]|nr:sigma-54-dependent Fis family transcriptional regulator [Clostridia bacterium]